MVKYQIELVRLIPNIRDEKDHRIQQLIRPIIRKKGIEKVYVQFQSEEKEIKLCVDFDPAIVTGIEVETLVRNIGADVTRRFCILTGIISNIGTIQKARIITDIMSEWAGVKEISISASGSFLMEFDQDKITLDLVLENMMKQGTPFISGEHTINDAAQA